MTHKFANNVSAGMQQDATKPVLYRIEFKSGYYYIHKGKELVASCNRFLYDIFRAAIAPVGKELSISPDYKRVVEYCKKYPQLNSVRVEVLFNGEPEALLKKERKMWTDAKKDEMCLNDKENLPYTPEWMIRHKYVARCEKCIANGTVDGKKVKFVFCPMCGKSIKK